MPDPFVLPRDDEHSTIVGRNGSGKTQMGAWLLSKQNLRRKPWVIIDYKGDALLNSIPHVRAIEHGDTPDVEGLHMLHSNPGQDVETDDFFWRIWEQGDIGVYIDEGYMVPGHRGSAYEALLTQGRSLRIPVITLSQRPVRINRFAFSEASHIVSFHLNDRRDIATVAELVPEDFLDWMPDDFAPFREDGKLPPYHSRWYALKTDQRYLLRPVPAADTIRAEIVTQIEPRSPAGRPSWRERLKTTWGLIYG